MIRKSTDNPAAARPAPRGQDYSIADVDRYEKLAIEKANQAISTIENAMAVWDASPSKPDELKPRMVRLRYFYDSITEWEKKALMTVGQPDQIGPRVERLKEYTDICNSFA